MHHIFERIFTPLAKQKDVYRDQDSDDGLVELVSNSRRDLIASRFLCLVLGPLRVLVFVGASRLSRLSWAMASLE